MLCRVSGCWNFDESGKKCMYYFCMYISNESILNISACCIESTHIYMNEILFWGINEKYVNALGSTMTKKVERFIILPVLLVQEPTGAYCHGKHFDGLFSAIETVNHSIWRIGFPVCAVVYRKSHYGPIGFSIGPAEECFQSFFVIYASKGFHMNCIRLIWQRLFLFIDSEKFADSRNIYFESWTNGIVLRVLKSWKIFRINILNWENLKRIEYKTLKSCVFGMTPIYSKTRKNIFSIHIHRCILDIDN